MSVLGRKTVLVRELKWRVLLLNLVIKVWPVPSSLGAYIPYIHMKKGVYHYSTLHTSAKHFV
jgi:hypothetical protein